MKERPILFSGPMVRAILDGRKTQTRRVVKQVRLSHGITQLLLGVEQERELIAATEKYVAGDRLWVRETIKADPVSNDRTTWRISYAADGSGVDLGRELPGDTRLRYGARRVIPSIYMPRWASRLTLEITDVRVQRLQEISEEDARAEGAKRVAVDPVGELWEFEYGPGNTVLGKLARNGFIHLWDSINGERAPWASNPWVWAITFRRVA